jgi:GDP-D-mannose dehydratase
MRGNENFLGKSGVYILLHYERKKQYNMAKAGNLKTKRDRGYGEEYMRPMHG